MRVVIAPEALTFPKDYRPDGSLSTGTFADVPDNGAEPWSACDAAYQWLKMTGGEYAHVYDRDSGTKLAYLQRTVYE